MKRIIALTSFFLWLPMAHATVAFVQANGSCTQATAGTTITCTFGASVASGDTLIASVSPAGYPATAFTITLSDNINGAWPAYILQCFASENAQTDVFVLPSSAAGTVTVTATLGSSATRINMGVIEYSGAASTLDGTPACSAATYSNPAVSPTLTTTLTTDLIVTGVGNEANSGAISVAAPYTLRAGGGTNYQSGFADYAPGTVGSQAGASYTVTYSGEAAYAYGLLLKVGGAPASHATQVGAFVVGP